MSNCKKIFVDEDVCSIKFGDGIQKFSRSFITCRDEKMRLFLDEKKRVIKIELLSDKKPCQS